MNIVRITAVGVQTSSKYYGTEWELIYCLSLTWVSLWGHYPGCSVEWLPVAAEGRPSIAAIMLPIAAEGGPAVAAIIEWWTAAAGSSTHTPSSLKN